MLCCYELGLLNEKQCKQRRRLARYEPLSLVLLWHE